jgi:hypothetical protein
MLVAVEGTVPVEQVWHRYTRPALWSEWAPQISRVDIDAAVIEPGARGTVRGPLLTFAPFRIRSVDHTAHRWSWWVGIGLFGVGMDHGVDETATGSRAWVRIHAHRYLAAPYAPLARLALRRLVRD